MKIKSYLAGKTRKLLLLLFDASCFAFIAVAYYFANVFLAKPIVYDPSKFLANAGILLLTVLVSRFALGVYGSVLRYTRTLNSIKIIIADTAAGCTAVLFAWICRTYDGFWFFVITASLSLIAGIFARMCYRMFYKLRKTATPEKR